MDFVRKERFCREGNAIRALELIYVLWDKGSVPSLIACTVMIDGLRRLRKTEETRRLVEKMLKEGMVLDVVTFNCVLQDICNERRTEEANKLRLLASSKGLEPDGMTYKILVTGYMGEGSRKEGELVSSREVLLELRADPNVRRNGDAGDPIPPPHNHGPLINTRGDII
ncbi:Tetratricopeptide-like helical domain superfamily [Sesbania bispinosa]|nr:Tetratricopeptide-like helical domain superfamily [Sesbania bispinosa]